MSNPDLDLTGLPDEPVINLDEWIVEQLPIEDADLFYESILKLEANHCRGAHETTFVYALQAAAYGSHERLSNFLSHDEYFHTLTKPKRQLLAWIMENPKPQRKNHLNSYNRMKSISALIASLVEVCGYSKTKAINTAIDSHINSPSADQSLEAHDARERRRESLKTQIKREIKPGGLVHEYYIQRTKEIRDYHEEMERLREK